MKYSLLIMALATIFLSCNNKPTGTQDLPVEGCYSYVYDKDSVSMHLEGGGKNVSGSLIYHFLEKDRNAGTIKGEMKGDTLWAQYVFMSEGTTSTRQVVFLRKGETFVEGFGKLNDSTGEPDFSDKAAIHFDSKMILKKTDCPDKKP